MTTDGHPRFAGQIEIKKLGKLRTRHLRGPRERVVGADKESFGRGLVCVLGQVHEVLDEIATSCGSPRYWLLPREKDERDKQIAALQAELPTFAAAKPRDHWRSGE